MEHGGLSFHNDHQEKSSSDTNPELPTNNVGAEIVLGGANDAPRNVVVQKDDHSMPIVSLARIMQKVLPSQAKVAAEAKETMQVCVTEFISFITCEANERCRNERRKIVTAEDIFWAMDSLGFDNYLRPLRTFLKHYRHNEVGNVRHLEGQCDVPTQKVVEGYCMSSQLSPLAPQCEGAHYGPNSPAGPSLSQGMFGLSNMSGIYNDESSSSDNVVSNVDPSNSDK